MPVIDTATIAGTTLRYRDPQMKVFTDVTFDTVTSTGTHINDAIRARATGTVRGNPFTATANLLTPNSALAMGRTKVDGTIDGARTHLDFAGDLAGPTKIEGAQLDLGDPRQQYPRYLRRRRHRGARNACLSRPHPFLDG